MVFAQAPKRLIQMILRNTESKNKVILKMNRDGKLRYPDLAPYEMESILHDLVQFSAAFLAVGGRLVYWLPTVAEEYKPEDVPQHPSLRIVSNSEQAFGQWSRRLITMEKIRPALSDELDPVDAITGALGHSHFRDRYFRGFKNE